MKLHHRPQPRNSGELPLFAWAIAAERRYARPLPLPARRICQRFGLTPAAATITAELAGFAMESSR